MSADDIRQLIPAFLAAAAVIVIVGLGVVLFVWRQYQPKPAVERDDVRRGFQLTGAAAVVFAGIGFGTALALHQSALFGPASLLVELAIGVDGVIFLVAARMFR